MATTAYRNVTAFGGQQHIAAYVVAAKIPLDTTRTLAKIAIAAPGNGTISIFAGGCRLTAG